MFKKNERHLQPVLICSVNELPEEVETVLALRFMRRLPGAPRCFASQYTRQARTNTV